MVEDEASTRKRPRRDGGAGAARTAGTPSPMGTPAPGAEADAEADDTGPREPPMPPTRQARADTGFIPGAIVRVACENFVTYDAVEFFPGPHLNMVIGPNGTGKSTIVCAIALGLGWPPTVLGRAKDAASYVKLGKASGWVELELQGMPGGRNVVIRRTIFYESSTSDWTLNGAPATGKSVAQAIAPFHIQVGNLCAFLPQDRVAEFAQMSPQVLLLETEQAAGHERLPQWHERLIDEGRQRARVRAQAAQEQQEHDHLEERASMLERDVRRYEERVELERRIGVLQLRILFAQYREARARYGAARTERQVAKDAVREATAALAPLATQRAGLDERLLQMRTQLGRHRAAVDDALRTLTKLAAERDKKERDTGALHEEEKQLEVLDAERRRTWEQLRARIGELEDAVARAPPAPETGKQELRLRTVKGEHRLLVEELHDLDAQSSSVQHDQQRAAARCADAEKRLAGLDSVQQQRLEVLRTGDRDTYEAVLWLREHAAVFHRTVHEPVIVALSIERPAAARAIETCLNWTTQRTFVCESRADYDLFTRELIDRRGWRLNVVEMEGGKRLADYAPPLDRAELAHLGFDAYALDCVQAPEDVLRYLCSSSNLHAIPIAFDARVDPEAIEACRQLRRYIIGDTIFTVTYSNYGRRLPQTMSRDLKPLRNFASTGNVHEKARVEQVLRELRAECDARDASLRALHADAAAKRVAMAERAQTRDALAGEVRAVMQLRAERERERVLLESERAKLAREERRPPVAVQRRALETQRRALAVALADVAARTRQALRRAMDARLVYDKLALGILRTEADLGSCRECMREQQQLVADAEHALEGVVDAFARAKGDAVSLQRQVQARIDEAADEQQDELRAHLRDNDESVDQLELELRRAQAALDIPWGVGPGVLETFRARKEKMAALRASIQALHVQLTNYDARIARVEHMWLPQLAALMERVNARFAASFQRLGCAGEVRLARDDDYAQWGVDLLVKFRDTEQLQLLTRQRQSGGERSLTTILYLLSLTELSSTPFSLVDEINQGMDPRAERAVHNQMVDVTCAPDAGQYFLITPKLLSGLQYHERMKVLLINNGDWLPERLHYIMPGEGWLFLFAIFMTAVLLFVMVFYVIMYSDLESDYVNPIDLCSKLNQFTLPEMAAHAFLTTLFLLSGQWMALVINLPLVAYNVNKIVNRTYLLDATEIFRTLMSHKKESFAKLGFYLLSFFYYLYRVAATWET
ncbi:Structural maintenance of chromosomes protein 5 [Malassezia sp. CBS 17886]|nr:Structural maintenance of chromosomes protein 5 [Malassezia sp. CBS 17886]